MINVILNFLVISCQNRMVFLIWVYMSEDILKKYQNKKNKKLMTKFTEILKK